jgi:hypothetical protein
MAWYSGTFAANPVGSLIPILDAKLPLNAYWSIYDAVAGVAADVLVNGNFALGNTGWTVGANWSTATGKCVHTAGAGFVQTVTQAYTCPMGGYYYDLVFTVAGMTAGTLTVTCTNATGSVVVSADGTYTIHLLTTSSALTVTFTPTATFDGNFDDVSLTQILTNCKVYECKDTPANCLFYMKVDDEHLGFSIIELWEGWNAGTHVGVGVSLKAIGTSGIMRIIFGVGGWGLSVRDHCFRFDNLAGDVGNAYVGQPRRCDVSKNIVLFLGTGSATSSLINILGMYAQAAEGCWATLFDENGNKVIVILPFPTGSFWRLKTINGGVMLRETAVLSATTNFILGELEGVCSYGAATLSGMSSSDTVVIGGITWRCCNGGSNNNVSFSEQA